MQPLITICGTTAVGKSNLGIELALRLASGGLSSGWKGARIINADSMQVYAGLDILTNKVPEDQRQGIDHLLMGFKKPGEQYVVGQWVRDALKIIKDVHAKNEIPIVVGGTSYWIQHLIFPNRLVQDCPSEITSIDNRTNTTNFPSTIANIDKSLASLPTNLLTTFENLPSAPPSAKLDPEHAFQLHSILAILDPVMAGRWHWRDTRKVLRNLQIIKEHRRKASDMVAEQSLNPVNNRPRFRTLNFWLYAEPSELEMRINTRVDIMMEQGLLDELRQLRAMENGLCQNDFTLSIYQSIGYREFNEYLSSPNPTNTALQDATNRMKLSTKQYAKKQISWIRNKLLPAINMANINEQLVPTFLLDATALGDAWEANVRIPAVQLMEDFLNGKELPPSSSLSETAKKMLSVEEKCIDPQTRLIERQKMVCEVCTVDMNRPVMVDTGAQWEAHKNARNHRRMERQRFSSPNQ